MKDSLSAAELTRRLQTAYDELDGIMVPGGHRLIMARAEVSVEAQAELSKRLNAVVLNINLAARPPQVSIRLADKKGEEKNR